MILAVDVAYQNDSAMAGGVLFRDWTDEKPFKEFVVPCMNPGRYRPGQFYRRELPCIAFLLEQVPDEFDFIVIDGFVYLGRDKKPGLGKHLRDLLQQKVVVIGVAKTAYKDTPKSCELLRGSSKNPIYITADGINAERAKRLIKSMHGQARVPTLLKYVDHLSRVSASPE